MNRDKVFTLAETYFGARADRRWEIRDEVVSFPAATGALSPSDLLELIKGGFLKLPKNERALFRQALTQELEKLETL
jgi:hypothetical protein